MGRPSSTHWEYLSASLLHWFLPVSIPLMLDGATPSALATWACVYPADLLAAARAARSTLSPTSWGCMSARKTSLAT